MQLVEQHADVETVLDNSVASRAHVQAVSAPPLA
jgi:hypothetical protein